MSREPGKQARVEVMFEQLRSEFRTVVEGQSLRFDSLERKFDQFQTETRQRFDFLEHAVVAGFKDVRNEIEALRKQFQEHTHV